MGHLLRGRQHVLGTGLLVLSVCAQLGAAGRFLVAVVCAERPARFLVVDPAVRSLPFRGLGSEGGAEAHATSAAAPASVTCAWLPRPRERLDAGLREAFDGRGCWVRARGSGASCGRVVISN